jgi:hypothetical protein
MNAVIIPILSLLKNKIMKTRTHTGITLILSIVAFTAVRAQNPSLKLAEDEQIIPDYTHVQPFETSRYPGWQSVKRQLSLEKQTFERIGVQLLTQDGTVLYSEWEDVPS